MLSRRNRAADCSPELARWIWSAAALLAAVMVSLTARGQGDSKKVASSGGDDRAERVAATVNGIPIFAAQVEQSIRRTLGNRQATGEALRKLQATALEQLIKQQLVLASLDREGQSANSAEVDFAINRLKQQLARQERELDDYCLKAGLNKESLRHTLRWQISWKRYLEKYLTDENLQRYFADHRHEFDGTRLRVAQILIKAGTTAQRVSQALGRAREIREDIVSGKTAFGAAARKYSDSPSGENGGELGWISRHEPMPEVFSRAAYALAAGEVSQPVISSFGVHLIKCLEIEQGQMAWNDVRDKLVPAVTRYLFDWNARRERPQADIRYTGVLPHFSADGQQILQ